MAHTTLGSYLWTYAILLALATLAWQLTGLPHGLALSLSLAIALVKAVLVLMRFMHLREESFSFRYIMLISALLVSILIVLTTLDPLTRGPHAPAPEHNASYAADSRSDHALAPR